MCEKSNILTFPTTYTVLINHNVGKKNWNNTKKNVQNIF